MPTLPAILLLAIASLTQPAPRPPQAAVDPDRVMADLAALPTARAARGTIASQQGLAATEDLLIATLTEMGYTPTLHPISWNLDKQAEMEAKLREETPAVESRLPPETTPELSSRTWHNIIVEIPGKELPGEVLIVSAHFDAVPGSPGADDDGSGVAALLEAARILKDRPMRRTVRLIFFNLEELGLVGSRDYLRGLKPRLAKGEEKIVGMVSLEMIGYYTDKPNSQRSPIPPIDGVFDPPTVGDFLALVTTSKHQDFSRRWAAAMQQANPQTKLLLADFFPVAPPDFLRSDHAPFLLSGIPALMLTDTSNFRNPHYHSADDTIGTLDRPRYIHAVRAVVGATHTLAEPVP